MTLATDICPDMHLVGAAAGSVVFPRYADTAQRVDNVTDWALEQFRARYESAKKTKRSVTKEDIFHYVYAVLHDPIYREKYGLNLKREFPRVPFYPDFWRWVDWGQRLMVLHIGYETVEPWQLTTWEDFRYKEALGERPAAMALLHWYTGWMFEKSSYDASVASTFYRVMHMIDPPCSIFHPSIIWKTIGSRRAPGSKQT